MRRSSLLAVALLLMSSSTFAQETSQLPKKETVSKTVTGIVSGIGYNFIAVNCGQDEKEGVSREMAFNLDKAVKVEHKPDIKSIKTGDTVSISYDETTEALQDGSKTSKRVTKTVVFLRPAQNKPDEADSGSLESSGGSADMPLPIKGMKKGD